MGVAKVALNGTTLIDISDTTATASTVLTGNGCYGADGEWIDGTASSGATINNQNKTVTPTESQQSITADSGYTGLGTVTVGAISSTYVGSGITVDPTPTVSGATVTIPEGYYSDDTTATVSSGEVTSWNIYPSSTSTKKNYTTSPNYTAGYFSTLGGNTIEFTKQSETVTPTENSQTITPTGDYYYITSVTVNAIPSTYVGSGITSRSSSDLTASGATVTVPAGYYALQATKSISTGTVTAPSSISGTSASVSTGTNTLTLTKTVSVTPSVTTAGYISSGTAGNASVSLTASVTTKGAATYTPTTTNQTISSGTYLTGTQTIAGDANLVGSNILSGKSIFGVAGTVTFSTIYTGTSNPSASIGSNGDIYIKTAT